MFGLSLNSQEKLLEAGALPRPHLESLRHTPGHPSRIKPLGASTQGRPKAPLATQYAVPD